jgi:hypothetical protein
MNQQKSLKTEAGIFVVQYGGTRKKKPTTSNNQSERFWTFEIL